MASVVAFRSMNNFGAWLKRTRNEIGYTQIQLGIKVNRDKSTISRWESGALEIRPEEVVDIVNATGREDLLERFCQFCPINKRKAAVPAKTKRPACC